MKRWRKHLLKYSLIILFLGYYGSITLFSHTHYENGKAITHSHPYKPSNDDKSQSHQHAQHEFVLISLLTHFFTTALFIVLSITAAKITTHILVRKREEAFLCNSLYLPCGMRGPPIQ